MKNCFNGGLRFPINYYVVTLVDNTWDVSDLIMNDLMTYFTSGVRAKI